MNIWWRRLFVALLAGSMMAFVACSDDENGQDNDSSPDAGDEHDVSEGDDASEGDDSEIDDNSYEPGHAEFESDYQLILNAFAFDSDSPAGDGPLNNVIHFFLNQTQSTPIIVLVELEGIDIEDEEMLIRAGAGLHAGEPGGGEYVWDDELEEPDSTYGTIDADGELYGELELLNFVATVETGEETMKTIIPIRDIELDGMLRADEDGSNPRMIDVDLQGVIWYDEVKDLELALEPGGPAVALVSESILDVEEMNYIYDPDDEGIDEYNAWEMSATFSAEETIILE